MGKRNFKEDSDWERAQVAGLMASGVYPDGSVAVVDRATQKRGLDIDGPGGSFEIKVVRWPGRTYTAVTLEEWSNVERASPGWMDYCEADFLDYCFVQQDGSWLLWRFRMMELRRWFVGARDRYPKADTQNAVGEETYTTRCRVVPLADISQFANISGLLLTKDSYK